MSNFLESNLLGFSFDNSYSRLPERFFEVVSPTLVKAPKIVRINSALYSELGLSIKKMNSDEARDVFSGNKLPPESRPIAQAYSGHQFGHFIATLGDGRAILIGEHLTPKGKRVDIQLKGSGRTRFSRNGDGRATLAAVMREFIIGEALHHLGIPTTRTLAIVTSGEEILRESPLPGAIQTRVAASHIRVGTFEYFKARNDHEAIKILADYIIERHYPECRNFQTPYQELAARVISRQAVLVARWLEVGFIHGVMNTDNMALSGESIDFGPCAFMNNYDPKTVFSSIDQMGRYAYSAQPIIAQWNLARFLETILTLIHDIPATAIEKAQSLLKTFSVQFKKEWYHRFRAKLGLYKEEESDLKLIEECLEIMHKNKLDFTNTFRSLCYEKLAPHSELLLNIEFKAWYKHWLERISEERNQRRVKETLSTMRDRNPAIIPRNHLVEEALEAGTQGGDFSVMDSLVAALARPFENRVEDDRFSCPPIGGDQGYQTFCGT